MGADVSVLIALPSASNEGFWVLTFLMLVYAGRVASCMTVLLSRASVAVPKCAGSSVMLGGFPKGTNV